MLGTLSKTQKELILRVLNVAYEDNLVFLESNESYSEEDALDQCKYHEDEILEAISIINDLTLESE